MMRRLTVDGKILNQRTADMVTCAEKRLGFNLWVVQGSYNAGGVSASGGTHDGGGAVDFSVNGLTTKQINEAVLQLREVGFAAWFRDELYRDGKRVWGKHIHAIAIGDPEMSSGAAQQVKEYYAGQDGLAGTGRDQGQRLNPIPVWPIRFPTISLPRAKAQFTEGGNRVLPGVRRIQRMLNHRINAGLVEDGKAGTKTKAAYKAWEKKIGANIKDGIPNAKTLKPLIAGFYRMSQ